MVNSFQFTRSARLILAHRMNAEVFLSMRPKHGFRRRAVANGHKNDSA
jgi:hypothetical protein